MNNHLILISRERILGTKINETSNLIYTEIKIRTKKCDGEYIKNRIVVRNSQYRDNQSSPYNSLNNATNEFGFVYSNAGAPVSGSFISFGWLGNGPNYFLQLVASYNSGTGSFWFRTKNGDAGTWMAWHQIWHDGNVSFQTS